ncbi:MAG: WYL domain-containing protein [Ruminococcaceae bacterium]|nr:WYL domain-containing protein [Oscillospiraceae bacterium]
MAKKINEFGFEEFEARHGKQNNQKLKPYLVLQYLLRNTDESHVVSADDIVEFLKRCGIYAERRSIYRDIKEINKIMWLLENKTLTDDSEFDDGVTVEDAEDALAEDEDDEEKFVVYQKHAKTKGFYVRQRHYNSNDIRLLAECIYSARFLSQKEADRLSKVVCEFVSKYDAKNIRHDAFLTDRVKTQNQHVLGNIGLINDAMSFRIDGEAHTPEKITFKYLKYSINDVNQQAERRGGETYKVSPYKLLINDGFYYLLAFDDAKQKMMTYRVDRMKGVSFTNEPRDGKEAFDAIDLRDYTKRVFSMFGGKRESVTIRFINPLLDAVVDRFGNDKNSVYYAKCDDRHFTVTTRVEISDQFFGWVLGFGKKAKLLESEYAVEEFKKYLDKVREMY